MGGIHQKREIRRLIHWNHPFFKEFITSKRPKNIRLNYSHIILKPANSMRYAIVCRRDRGIARSSGFAPGSSQVMSSCMNADSIAVHPAVRDSGPPQTCRKMQEPPPGTMGSRLCSTTTPHSYGSHDFTHEFSALPIFTGGVCFID